MSKKITIEYVKSEIESKGYKLISKEYINSYTKLHTVCPEGHGYFTCWSNFKSGRRCRKCYALKQSKDRKMNFNIIQKAFDKAGYELLTTADDYQDTNTRFHYTCDKGHKDSISWGSFQQGHRCKKCFYKSNSGKNHPNWNFNMTDEERMTQRKYPEYYEWRKIVYERDDYTCQICGVHGARLVAHHLESYTNNKELRITVSNGITLCKRCHKNFYHQYGNGNNTTEQFEEFRC